MAGKTRGVSHTTRSEELLSYRPSCSRCQCSSGPIVLLGPWNLETGGRTVVCLMLCCPQCGSTDLVFVAQSNVHFFPGSPPSDFPILCILYIHVRSPLLVLRVLRVSHPLPASGIAAEDCLVPTKRGTGQGCKQVQEALH